MVELSALELISMDNWRARVTPADSPAVLFGAMELKLSDFQPYFLNGSATRSLYPQYRNGYYSFDDEALQKARDDAQADALADLVAAANKAQCSYVCTLLLRDECFGLTDSSKCFITASVTGQGLIYKQQHKGDSQ